MTVTLPGDVEWAPDVGSPLLLSVAPMADLWLPLTVDRAGWQVTWTANDLATEAGGSPGLAVPEAMYPSLIGVAAETADDLLDLVDAMTAGAAGVLTWWDQPTDRVLIADAYARRCEPSTGQGVQLAPHRLVDVMWMVPRPLEIVEGS